MDKTKIFILACLFLLLSLAGFLILRKTSSDKDKIIPAYSDFGKVSASTVSPGSVAVDKTGKTNSGDYTYNSPVSEYDDNNENKEEDQMTDIWSPATEMDLDPNSITVFVNKEYCLPKDFVPSDLVVPDIDFDISGFSERKQLRKEVAEAIEKLFAAALEEGYTLYGVSGYRSYSRQKEIFLNNIVKKGKSHTLKYSAAPGTSEHQTGLAMDVSAKSVRFKLVTAFANCPEGKWLAAHAHEYGFIIRYPADRTEITGYAYEPWHIRYVGKNLAAYLYANDLTLDEYYNYVPSEGFDYEKKYADLINYRPPVTPTPLPEDVLDEDNLDDDMPDDLPDDLTDELSDDVPDDFPDDWTDDDIYDDGNASIEDPNANEDITEDETPDVNEQDSNVTDIDSGKEDTTNEAGLSPTPAPSQSPSVITDEDADNYDADIIN